MQILTYLALVRGITKNVYIEIFYFFVKKSFAMVTRIIFTIS